MAGPSNISGPFSPGVGIERIIGSHEGPGAAALPHSTKVLPSDSITDMEGLHKLYAPAWDKAMQRYMQPSLSSRELLIPSIFSARIQQARRELNEAARQKKSRPLREAALLLEDDDELKKLLDVYRNLLLQG